MKVMIISKDPNKQGREKNILKIVGSFDGDMDIEFYAYGTKNNEMDIFSNIPIFVIDTSRLEPPYDKKGRVTPVTGIKPTTTDKLRIV